jgi:hypothetical protein
MTAADFTKDGLEVKLEGRKRELERRAVAIASIEA